MTHLALTLELLLLLEGQGAGEHRARVVEAVLDHALILVREPGAGGRGHWRGSGQHTCLPVSACFHFPGKSTQRRIS